MRKIIFISLVFIFLGVGATSFAAILNPGNYTTTTTQEDVEKSGNFVYIANGTNGLLILDVGVHGSVSNPVIEGSLDLTGSDNCKGIDYVSNHDGTQDYVFIADATLGLIAVNVEDPTTPVEHDDYVMAGGTDVMVVGDLAVYCQADRVKTMDVSNVDALAKHDNLTLGGDYTPKGVDMSGNYAYVAAGVGGLAIINISTPANISTAGIRNTPGFAYGVAYSAGYAYIADGSAGLVVVDVSTPGTPVTVGRAWGMDARDVVVAGDYAYIADQRHVVTVVDISDPTDPYAVAWRFGTTSSPASRISRDGNYCYIAAPNYGIKIMKTDNLTNWVQDLASAKYEMRGIPWSVLNGDVSTLFGDDLGGGASGPTSWRCSRWNVADQTHYRYGENNHPINTGGDPADFSPGLGFWMIQIVSANPKLRIQAAENTGLVPQDARYEIDLQDVQNADRGLNQMANPFPYTYNWENTSFRNATTATTSNIVDAATAGWINGYAYKWKSETSSYGTVQFNAGWGNNIQEWEGVWVEVLTTDNILVRFKPDNYTGGLMPPLRDEYPAGWDLFLPVATADGQYSDYYNIAGIKEGSEAGYDPMDAFEYTPFSNRFVHLYFPHDDWEESPTNVFTYDNRAFDFEGVEEWDFNVRTWNLPNEDLVLSWPTALNIDDDYSFTIMNLDNGDIIHDLRNEFEYRFDVEDEQLTLTHFRLRVQHTPTNIDDDPITATPSEFGLVSVFPNPFNDQAQISYNLPATTDIKLNIYDAQGRFVSTLYDGNNVAGLHKVAWNGKEMASGMYLLKLESGNTMSSLKVMLLH